ncbi:MAG: hypothetical protein VCA55_12055 [Verrucomicrobiales bacterium]
MKCIAISSVLLINLLPLYSQEVPEDLIGDEHVREEFGINHFTTPSIKKLFEDLDDFGELPYERLKRGIPKKIPRDRSLVALGLGSLIAEGFLIVQAEELTEIEKIGRAVLKQAKVLGAGMRVTRHTKSILENSVLGEWEELKIELSKTQADVEAEMVMLCDVDIAHLVALGGWLRSFEIAAITVSESYSEKKAGKLTRTDLLAYFLETLQGLEPKLRERAHIVSLSAGIEDILADLGGYDPKPGEKIVPAIPSKAETIALAQKINTLLKIIESHQ